MSGTKENYMTCTCTDKLYYDYHAPSCEEVTEEDAARRKNHHARIMAKYGTLKNL